MFPCHSSLQTALREGKIGILAGKQKIQHHEVGMVSVSSVFFQHFVTFAC